MASDKAVKSRTSECERPKGKWVTLTGCDVRYEDSTRNMGEGGTHVTVRWCQRKGNPEPRKEIP